MSLNLRQIEVFRAVMTTGSIAGAADMLHISQPAVSRLLAHTESRLQFKLFERTKGRLYPTPEAKSLIHEVENVYRGVRRVNDLAADLVERRQGTLHIVSSPSIGQSLVPKAIAAFRVAYPETRVNFQFLSYVHLRERLLNRQAEIGVIILPMEHPSLEVMPLARGSMVCICPNDHPLARYSSLKLADLRPYPLISYAKDTPLGARISAMYEAADEPLSPAVEVGSPQNAYALVEMGVGIGIVDEFSGRSWPGDHLAIRSLAEAPDLVANLVRVRYEPLSAPAGVFVDVLRGQLASHGFELAVPLQPEAA